MADTIHINPKNKGKLHKKLHIAPGRKIPESDLSKALLSKSPAERKEAVFAENARKWRH
jgi:hypothetical protein